MAVAAMIPGLAGPASAGISPEPFNHHPVGEGHWQARAGLADRTVGFATNALPGGIILPCLKVGYESDGRVAHLLVRLDGMLTQPPVLDDIVVGDETWGSAADSSAT